MADTFAQFMRCNLMSPVLYGNQRRDGSFYYRLEDGNTFHLSASEAAKLERFQFVPRFKTAEFLP